MIDTPVFMRCKQLLLFEKIVQDDIHDPLHAIVEAVGRDQQ